jgi:hypothetical protein
MYNTINPKGKKAQDTTTNKPFLLELKTNKK